MKKLFFYCCFSFFLVSNAQLDVGIKAGLNYNSLSDLNITGGFAGINEDINSEGQLGFHAGLYAQFDFTKFYVKGELLYVENSSTYDDMRAPSSKFKLSTLELPVLVGFKVAGPLRLYVGTSLVYNIDSDFTDFFEFNFDRELSLAYNIGASVTFNKINIDLRYSSGFSENIASYLEDMPSDGFGYTLNTRPSQFLLSLSYKIN